MLTLTKSKLYPFFKLPVLQGYCLKLGAESCLKVPKLCPDIENKCMIAPIIKFLKQSTSLTSPVTCVTENPGGLMNTAGTLALTDNRMATV